MRWARGRSERVRGEWERKREERGGEERGKKRDSGRNAKNNDCLSRYLEGILGLKKS